MNIFRLVQKKKKYIYIFSLFCHLRGLVFDQSFPVHPVSESMSGVVWAWRRRIEDGQNSLCLTLDDCLPSLKTSFPFVADNCVFCLHCPPYCNTIVWLSQTEHLGAGTRTATRDETVWNQGYQVVPVEDKTHSSGLLLSKGRVKKNGKLSTFCG